MARASTAGITLNMPAQRRSAGEDDSEEETSSEEDDGYVEHTPSIGIRTSQEAPGTISSKSITIKQVRRSTKKKSFLNVGNDDGTDVFRRMSQNRQGTGDLLARLKQEKQRGNSSRSTTATPAESDGASSTSLSPTRRGSALNMRRGSALDGVRRGSAMDPRRGSALDMFMAATGGQAMNAAMGKRGSAMLPMPGQEGARRPSSVAAGGIADAKRASGLLAEAPFLPGGAEGARRLSALGMMPGPPGGPPRRGSGMVPMAVRPGGPPRGSFLKKNSAEITKKSTQEDEDSDSSEEHSAPVSKGLAPTPVLRPHALFGNRLSMACIDGDMRRPSTVLGTVTENPKRKSVFGNDDDETEVKKAPDPPKPSAMKGGRAGAAGAAEEKSSATTEEGTGSKSGRTSPKKAGVGFAQEDDEEDKDKDDSGAPKKKAVAFFAADDDEPEKKGPRANLALKPASKHRKTVGGADGEDRVIFRSLKDFIRHEAAQKAGRMLENVKHIQVTLEKTHDENNDLLKEYEALHKKEIRERIKKDGVTPETANALREFHANCRHRKRDRTTKQQELLRMDYTSSYKGGGKHKHSIFSRDDTAPGAMMRTNRDTLHQIVFNTNESGMSKESKLDPTKLAAQATETRVQTMEAPSTERRRTVKWTSEEEEEDPKQKDNTVVITIPVINSDSDSDSSADHWAGPRKKRMLPEVPRLRNRFRKPGLTTKVDNLMTVKRYREALLEMWGLKIDFTHDQIYTVSEEELCKLATEKYQVDRERAARSIQLYYRAIRIREVLKETNMEMNAATTVIQRWWRHILMWNLPIRYAIQHAKKARAAALVLQSAWRRYRIFKMFLGIRTIVKLGNQMQTLQSEIIAQDTTAFAAEKLQGWVRRIIKRKREEEEKKAAEAKLAATRKSVEEISQEQQEEMLKKKKADRRTSWCATGFMNLGAFGKGGNRRASQIYASPALSPTKVGGASMRFKKNKQKEQFTDLTEDHEAEQEDAGSPSNINSAESFKSKKSVVEDAASEDSEESDEERFPLDYDRVRMYGLPAFRDIEDREAPVEIRRRR